MCALSTDGTSRHPDYATGHVIATRLYFDQGMYAEAEFAARRVLELDPENIVGLSILVAILRGRGDAGAESVLARLVDVDPESDEALWAKAARAVETEAVADDEFFADPWDEPRAADDAVDEDDGLAGLTLRPDLDDPPDEDALDLAQLAPDEDALDLASLAPDEDALDLESLAPDEDALDLASLAPEDEVMDFASLAPDEVTGLSSLAPEEDTIDPASPVTDGDVADVTATAPGEEPMALDALRPDPTSPPEAVELDDLAPDAPTMDFGDLAPDDDDNNAEMEPIILDALAPDASDDDDTEAEAMDLDALAPDTTDDEEAEAEAMDLDALAPDATDDEEAEVEALDLDALAPDGDVHEDDSAQTNEPIGTRTLAELYVKQGFVDQAVSVYRRLLAAEPDAEDVRARLAQLEGGAVKSGTARDVTAPSPDEEVEALARDLAESGDRSHEVDTPFAWTDEAETVRDDSPGISDYFTELLSHGRDSRDRDDS